MVTLREITCFSFLFSLSLIGSIHVCRESIAMVLVISFALMVFQFVVWRLACSWMEDTGPFLLVAFFAAPVLTLLASQVLAFCLLVMFGGYP